MNNRIIVCSACEPNGGIDGAQFARILREALRDAGLAEQFEVKLVECLGACAKPVSLALQGRDRATYLFAGLSPASDISDIIATCRLFMENPQGWIEDASGCGRLRHLLRARIPAMP